MLAKNQITNATARNRGGRQTVKKTRETAYIHPVMSIHLNICIQLITHTSAWREHRNKLQIHSKHFSSLVTHTHCILLLPEPRQNECIHSSASSSFPPLFHHNHTFDEHYISQLLTEQHVATHCVQIATDLHCGMYVADILETSLKRLGILRRAQV